MSARPHDATHAPSHGHAGSLREYMTGFVLAVTLTAIPFWLVMAHTLGRSSTTAAVILALAAVQIVIHMVYFLHMNTRSEGGWTLLALLFTLMLVVIALSGSLWVMYHLNHNMMPEMGDEGVVHDTQPVPHMHDMHDMP
jgi:cytochrome o ubiquinol oxidase operon protein cyoD